MSIGKVIYPFEGSWTYERLKEKALKDEFKVGDRVVWNETEYVSSTPRVTGQVVALYGSHAWLLRDKASDFGAPYATVEVKHLKREEPKPRVFRSLNLVTGEVVNEEAIQLTPRVRTALKAAGLLQ